MNKLFLLILVLVFSAAENIYSQKQLKGAYILSEGGGSPGSALLSYYNASSDSFYLNIFSPGNIGPFPDGLIVSGQNLFLTEQGFFGGQGKIYKLTLNGEVLASNTIGINPYSMAMSNGKIYVTNGPAGNVSIIDTSDLSQIKTIPVGVYPQEILAHGNSVFVCNTSLFGGNQDSTISVIDAVSDSVVFTINVKKDPSSVVISKDSSIFIGCPGNGSSGVIYEINPITYQKIDSFYITNGGFGKDISVDAKTGEIRFISYNNSIVKLNPYNGSSSVLITNPDPSSVFFYGYGYDYINNRHFIADAGNFVAAGKLYIYNENGNLEDTYPAGVAPRRILFNIDNPVSIQDQNSITGDFTLKQNYPNPFNPSTIISYSLRSRSAVVLKVYDILGNEVSTLVDNVQNPGEYLIEFNAPALASGLYFYKLNAGSFSDVRKMVLVR